MQKVVVQPKYPWHRIEAVTVKQYRDALVALDREGKITPNQRDMLRVHCEAPGRTLTARQLGRKARIKGGYEAVNSQYGRLAHWLWDVLALPRPPEPGRQGRARWIGVLETFSKPPQRREWEGTMHLNLAKALRQIGWCGNRRERSRSNQVGPRPPGRASRHMGARFGDPERNELVELAAINTVADCYRSRRWHVESKEDKPVGYDLLCTRGRRARRVEVKGIRGATCNFIITANEKGKAAHIPGFRLIAVTNALRTYRRRLWEFTAAELLRKFRFEPISYMAKLR